MKKHNLNSDYERDRIISAMLGLQPVPFSGSRWDKGKEDGYDEFRLMQYKSTGDTSRNALTVKFEDLFQLINHAQKRIPGFVLDFPFPTVRSVTGILHLPESLWVAVPIDEYLRLWTPPTSGKEDDPMT